MGLYPFLRPRWMWACLFPAGKRHIADSLLPFSGGVPLSEKGALYGNDRVIHLAAKHKDNGKMKRKGGLAVSRITSANNEDISGRPLIFFAGLMPFFVGGFFEWASCAAAMFLLVYLFYCVRRQGYLRVPKSVALLAVSVTALAYGVSALWGVDHGMALIGFAKFLPLPLFALAASQVRPEVRRKMLETALLSGVVMTVASFILSRIPFLAGWFLVNGRLAGFFQYPNTFALFLLVGAAVIAFDERWSVLRALGLVVLTAGIFLTGSRAVLVMLLVAAVAAMFGKNDRRIRLSLAGAVVLLLAAVCIYAAATKDLSTAARLFTSSVSSSTFLGRLLYWRDALPVILKHPFGLGYLGYSFTQGSFQTGVYSVQHVHNDLLQFFLDVGWVPTALLVWAVCRGLKKGDRLSRAVIVLIAAHIMFDFDMQFIAVDFVLLAALDLDGEGEWRLKKRTALYAAGCVLSFGCVYFGAATGLYYGRAYKACTDLYPGYTNAWMATLAEAKDADGMDAVADRIISLNDSVSVAYSAKARAAYARGDFGSMIDYKRRAISLARYSLPEYLDYIDMLTVGVRLYKENGDDASADYCARQAQSVPEMLAEVQENSSALAWKIDEKPELSLPDGYLRKIEKLGGG